MDVGSLDGYHKLMETQDNKDPAETYWLDDYDEDIPRVNNFAAKRLVNGIDLKDLCDGKEVIIQLAEDDNEPIFKDDSEAGDEIIHCDPKTLREKRGGPPLNCKFEDLAKKMVNVTEDGLVKKQVVTSGIGKIVPDRAYVTIHYNMYKENCEVPFDSTYLRKRPEKFRLNQGETIPGLEHAIRSMKKQENSCFYIKWEVAYGALGCPDRIEPKCDIIADVTLINFVEIQHEQDLNALTQDELDKVDFNKSMSQVKQMICHGSDEFSRGNIKAAAVTYRKVLRLLNSLRLANEEQERLFLEKKVKVLVNLAVCNNKLGKPELACLACQEALSIDCKNVKANFHYGRANLALSNFKLAHEYLLRADRLKPNDGDINRELKKLNDKKALHEMADKIFWKKAFVNEGNENPERKIEEKAPCALVTFEQSLRESLEESAREKKPYILPGPILEDEKRVCSRVANSMNLNFETKEEFFVFSCRKENTGEAPK